MFSQSACYSKVEGLRLRPVPEMAICFVFTPARPKLYTLNTSAWLLLMLCDGRSGRALINGYKRAFGARLARGQAVAEVRETIEDLEGKGMVVCYQALGRWQER